MTRRESLARCLRELRQGRRRYLAGALRGLAGCPVGAWAETDQAMRQVLGAMPIRMCRAYTLDDLISSTMHVDTHTSRWSLSITIDLHGRQAQARRIDPRRRAPHREAHPTPHARRVRRARRGGRGARGQRVARGGGAGGGGVRAEEAGRVPIEETIAAIIEITSDRTK